MNCLNPPYLPLWEEHHLSLQTNNPMGSGHPSREGHANHYTVIYNHLGLTPRGNQKPTLQSPAKHAQSQSPKQLLRNILPFSNRPFQLKPHGKVTAPAPFTDKEPEVQRNEKVWLGLQKPVKAASQVHIPTTLPLGPSRFSTARKCEIWYHQKHVSSNCLNMKCSLWWALQMCPSEMSVLKHISRTTKF